MGFQVSVEMGRRDPCDGAVASVLCILGGVKGVRVLGFKN